MVMFSACCFLLFLVMFSCLLMKVESNLFELWFLFCLFFQASLSMAFPLPLVWSSLSGSMPSVSSVLESESLVQLEGALLGVGELPVGGEL